MANAKDAKTPSDITAKGWKDIAFRVKGKLESDHIGLIAAGVAFYALLAIFPAVTALMALGGLMLEPAQVTAQLETLTNMIPERAADIILDQAVAVAGSGQVGLGTAFVIGLFLAVYSASRGMGSLMEGLNVVFDAEETRGFVSRTLWTLALTVFLILGLLLGMSAVVAVPAALAFVALPEWVETLILLSRWLILAFLTILGLGIVYRYGPSRRLVEWKWLSPGAIAACVVWIAASAGFLIYASNFGSYNETFGSMAGVVILLMWLWISAFIVLLGAELNSELEAQADVDKAID
ncbi:YihY/virulence factor BrkB family protein [Yoonia sp. MH D7]